MHKNEFAELEKCEKEKKDALSRIATSSQKNVKSEVKQMSFQECVDKTKQWDNKSVKSLAVDKSISEMIALEDLLFSFVESAGFNILKEGLKAQETVVIAITKFKKMATHFHHSNTAQDELKAIQKRLNQTPLKSVRPDGTVPFICLSVFCKSKESLCLYASTNNKIPQLTSEEWMLIDKVITLLRPFEEVTKELSAADVSVSSLIPLIATLERILNDFDSTDELIGDTTAILKQELFNKFSFLENEVLFITVSPAIKKNTVQTFANLKKKKKMTVGVKVHEVKLQGDLFGRLLVLSLDTSIDLEKVLSFPITPMPLSLCHIDGSINKTDKSVLVHELEKLVEDMEQPPSQIDLSIVDGFFFLNTFKETPRTFGGVSKRILQCLINNTASRIAIVFDRYFTPSIKDYEHSIRGNVDDKEFHITGPQQMRTADFTKDLKNLNFKQAIVKFFIDHWADQEMAAIIGSKVIYIIHDLCYEYSVTDNKITRIINYELSCPDHEEADTKIAFLACQQKEDSTITIRTSDTDILVIMLANMEHLQATVEIWMDLGIGNARRYNKLGPKISKALPGLHAFTGCDFNPALYRRGKKKPLQFLMASETFHHGNSSWK
ncbi:hypothetical protein EVAR_21746_1 [Eumeta japonica]|uniref:Uncharacterized protein n=1 Tax=Eumeta variegata TaxID=151549 RepID=A0A4C1ZL94_EUMVA|nr:hypothetical protein EVAR_21746_1 [Eumeta japonica]